MFLNQENNKKTLARKEVELARDATTQLSIF